MTMNTNFDLSIKDVINWGITIVTAVAFFTTLNNKVDTALAAIKEIKDDRKEVEINIKNLENKVNATSQQVQLIEQKLEYLNPKN